MLGWEEVKSNVPPFHVAKGPRGPSVASQDCPKILLHANAARCLLLADSASVLVLLAENEVTQEDYQRLPGSLPLRGAGWDSPVTETTNNSDFKQCHHHEVLEPYVLRPSSLKTDAGPQPPGDNPWPSR